MPGNYEIHVGTSVNTDPLERLTRVTDAQKAATDRLNETMYGNTKASEVLTVAQVKHATELAKVEQWTLRYKTALLEETEASGRATGATERQTAAIIRLGNAHGAAVSQVQAVGGALRVVEGSMPIRAAERFLTILPGVGAAFQAAFPVFGLFAFTEVLQRTVKEVQHLGEAYNPVLQAQKQSLELQKQINREIETNANRLRDLQIQQIGMTQGEPTALREKAKDLEDKARTADAAAIFMRQQEVNMLQRVINAPSDRGVALTRQQLGILKTMPGGFELEEWYERFFGGITQAGTGALLNESIGPSLREAARQRLYDRQRALQQAQQAQRADELEAQTLRMQARQTEDTAATRQTSSEGRVDARLRTQDLERVVRQYGQILKAVSQAEKNLAKIVDEHAPELKDVSGRQMEDAMRGLRVGRELNPEVFGGITMPAPPGPSITEQRQALRLRSSRALRGPGSDDIEGRYELRLQIASQEYELDKKDAEAKHDQQRAEDALNQLIEKRYDAQMEREQAIADMIARQKQMFEQNVTGLLEAASQGRAGSWARQKAMQLGEDALARYLLGPIFDHLAGLGKPKTISIHDVIGAAAKDSTDQNTTATKDNTDALKDNTQALRTLAGSPSSGGGATAAGLGGMVNYGFPTAGGSGPLGSLGIPGPMGGIVNTVGTIGLGAYGLYSGLHSGGARGDLTAAAGAAAIAGKVLPMLSGALKLAGPIGMVASLGLGLVSSLFGDPKAARESQIQDRLKNNQFMAPVAINAAMSTGGTYADFDRFGNVRGSDFSPFPTVQQGYFDFRHNQVIPGRTLSQFGGPGGPPATPVVVQVQTMDSRSFNENSGQIADAMRHALDTGRAPGFVERMKEIF